MINMTDEQKKDFLEEVEHHREEEIEHAKQNWVKSAASKAMGHDCDMEAGSPNPLASCRDKHPPKPDPKGFAGNYTPYDTTRPPTPGM
jgi:hypothetical protein